MDAISIDVDLHGSRDYMVFDVLSAVKLDALEFTCEHDAFSLVRRGTFYSRFGIRCL